MAESRAHYDIGHCNEVTADPEHNFISLDGKLSFPNFERECMPPVWQTISHLNPFFYMIDGFRYGFFGVSDTSPWISLAVVGLALAGVSALALQLLRTCYKIRH